MGRQIGNHCLLAVLIALAAVSTGCNFFGKQVPDAAPPPGQLPTGTSIVGVWSVDFADTSTSDTPDSVVTLTYTFTGSGSASVEVRDQLSGGSICTATGPYQVDNTGNVDITVQATNPSSCEFPGDITLASPVVSTYSISFTDPTSGDGNTIYAALIPPLELVGTWQFNGQGGIDWILFDQNGYFLLQSTDPTTSQPFLAQGYYTLSQGTLTLNFMGADASDVLGSSVYTPISNTGQQLSLTDSSSGSAVVLTGNLL